MSRLPTVAQFSEHLSGLDWIEAHNKAPTTSEQSGEREQDLFDSFSFFSAKLQSKRLFDANRRWLTAPAT